MQTCCCITKIFIHNDCLYLWRSTEYCTECSTDSSIWIPGSGLFDVDCIRILVVCANACVQKLHFTITGTKETVYDDKVIIGIQWLVIVLSAIAIPLYHFTIIRYIAAFVLMVASLFLYKRAKYLSDIERNRIV